MHYCKKDNGDVSLYLASGIEEDIGDRFLKYAEAAKRELGDSKSFETGKAESRGMNFPGHSRSLREVHYDEEAGKIRLGATVRIEGLRG